ncbi:MAG: hypothetical protein MUP71_03695 [Candidatus Aminicenantes bacterium]|nr:hypothetical protein [Candidatus Aminicenantes bacterium]
MPKYAAGLKTAWGTPCFYPESLNGRWFTWQDNSRIPLSGQAVFDFISSEKYKSPTFISKNN